MAKKPDHPRRPQPGAPDDPKKPQPPQPPEPADSDSAINLGEPGEGDLSGISVIEWASLVEEAPAPTGASHVKIDSPSDAELIAQLSEPAPLPPAGEALPIVDETAGFVEDDASDSSSAIDLATAGRPPEEDEDVIVAELIDSSVQLAQPVAETAAGEELIDLGAEMQAAEPPLAAPVEAEAAAVGEVFTTADDLPGEPPAAEDVVEMLPGDEVIDLQPTAADEPLSGSPADVIDLLQPDLATAGPISGSSAIALGDEAVEEEVLELGSSGIDLGESVPVVPVEPGAESSIDLLAENLLFEENEPGSKNGGSSRDLIAEELESGLDLAKPGSEEEAVGEDDFFAQVGGDESSSVDLGSAHTIDVFTEEEARQAAEQGARERAARSPTPGSGINLDDFGVAEEHADVPVVSEEEVDLDKIGAFDDAHGGSPAEWGSMPTDEDAALGAEPVHVAAGEEIADLDEVAAIEEETEKPAKKDKKEKAAAAAAPRGSAGAWVGGTVLGTLIGAGACVAVWFAGLAPESGTPKPPVAVQPAQPPAPPPAEVIAREVAKIRAGQLDDVKPEVIANEPEAKPEDRVAHAEFLWLKYLRDERGNNPQAPLRIDAEPVKKALDDLNKGVEANLPDAVYLRAQIYEMTGDEAKARAEYQLGAKKFEANAAEKARFETALQVLDLSRKVSHWTPPGITPRLVALLFITLQQPPMGNPPAPGGAPAPGAPAPAPGAPAPAPLPQEAGFSFKEAIVAASKRDYDSAIKALDEARARHDRRRYLLPRQALNPKSDLHEDIFLRCCDELKNYWTLQRHLNNPNYLDADPKETNPQVKALLAKVNELMTKVDATARAEQLKKLAADLVKDKPVAKPEDLVKLIDAERKAAADKLTAADEAIAEQKKQLAGLSDKLKSTADVLTTTADQLTKMVAAEKMARTLGQEAVAVLKEVGGVVGSDFSDLKTSKETLLDDVRSVARMAKIVDPMGKLRQLERDLGEERARLAQRWEPAQMLGFWLPILQNDRDRLDLAARARADADRVLADPFAKPPVKAQAQLVQGLVLRNEDRFAEAQPVLKKAQDGLIANKSELASVAEAALAETADPAATFAARAEQLQAQGKAKEAQAVLARGLKVAPEPKGPLYLQRAKFAYEAARSRGALKSADPLVSSARADAAEAAKAGLAEGSYLLGRIAEDLNQLDDAIASYRQALQTHGQLDEAGSRYRIALARALLKQQPPAEQVPQPIPPATRTGQAPAARPQRVALDTLVLLMALTLQAGLPADRPASTPEQLADEVLALGDKAPFDARAQALAIKGLYTRALEVYTAGLRDKGLLAPEYANTLLELLAGHPVLRRPESKETPDPLRSEKHYAAGVNQFFAGQYARAEKELLSAIENDRNDARYHYYLGLARLAQGKREAYEDFDQGARLERQGRPDTAAVAASLERVQGQMRWVLNAARTRPVRNSAK